MCGLLHLGRLGGEQLQTRSRWSFGIKLTLPKTFVKMKDYHNAVNVFTEIANTAEQISKKPATSVSLDILAR